MSELNKLQRRLIPVNIAVMIIAIVAVISLAFMPILTIDMSKGADFLTEIVQEDQSQNSDGTNSGQQNAEMSTVTNMISSIKFSITTASVSKLAFADDPIDLLADAIAKTINKVADRLMVDMLVEMITSNSALGDSIDKSNIDSEDIYELMLELESADNRYEAYSTISEIAATIAEQSNVSAADKILIYDNTCDILSEAYEDTIYYADHFTIESFVCVQISKLSDSSSNENGDPAVPGTTDDKKIVTSYKQYIYNLFTSGENANSAQIADTLKSIGLSIFGMLAFYIFVWVLLFIFALVHLFMKNKRFLMWYVKLWGGYPCLIFGITPLLLKSILSAVIPESAKYLGILGIMSTMTWISGACYLLLWIVSIFWAFPIKRKIRNLLKQGATYD